MSEIDWGDLSVNMLPTGTVTLLLADVEGSTRLWETQPDAMTAAVAQLDRTLAHVVPAHDGVRPVEQGEGDSFVAAFARAADAVACALELQQAPLAPIRLRIGVHTGDIKLRDEANYIGPTINRTARLRDLAHGGQTVLSGITSDLVIDQLPAGAFLTDLGSHPLRDLPRPERVVQLCHPDLRNEFPALRSSNSVTVKHLPSHLTNFIGRREQVSDLTEILADNRLVTLTGAGGVGKTRLAVHVADRMVGEFGDGVWYVDLAPITDPDNVAITVARALGVADQPGTGAVNSVAVFVGERRSLIVLDNCEHLLDTVAELVAAVLAVCPRVALLTTTREPIGVPGEIVWRVPSLSLADEAVELFADRAQLAKPGFCVTDDTATAVTEICKRLDGMPLAIELAAARVRALSPAQILESLHDRFRLLTGGGRTAVRRQQTLRASVDWSHALLTEPERVLFRRLGVFMGGFDLDAAQAVCGGGEVQSYQVLDQLTLLVDKSLVAAEDTTRGRTRYRLLETVRQYAQEKLGESGEADDVRTRHRDYFVDMAARLDSPAGTRREVLDQAETEIDNLRGAFAWSREQSETEATLLLATSLHPLWLARGRLREGCTWFDSLSAEILDADAGISPTMLARALSDKATLDGWAAGFGAEEQMELAKRALAIARDVGDAALLARTVIACAVCSFSAELADAYVPEAIDLATALGDEWRLSQILGRQAAWAFMAGDPTATEASASRGRDIADAIGNPFESRFCRMWLALVRMARGELAGAIAEFDELTAEAEAVGDAVVRVISSVTKSRSLAYRGYTDAAVDSVRSQLGAVGLGGMYDGQCHVAMAYAELAAGNAAAAPEATARAWPLLNSMPTMASMHIAVLAQAALAVGDVASARGYADDAVETTRGWHLMVALTARARVAMATDELRRAEDDAHAAVACGAEVRAYLVMADAVECLALLAVHVGSQSEAARLFGAADAMRQRTGEVRFKVYDAEVDASIVTARSGLGDNDFDAAWAEGAALSTEETIAYAQRGRGERKRPSSGWASLTPTEVDVVRLAGEGLSNKDIGGRLFVSPRTVQTHLTHVYAKLGLTSRVQLVHATARHA
jgi:predicted ATPase/class 3 adenylate cyclase/DNA-binding CsgD family transcriptional regulator